MRSILHLVTSNLGGAALIASALSVAGASACQPKPAESPDTAAAAAPSSEAAPETGTAAAADAHDAKKQAAQTSAESWLALIDQTQYAASWDAAAPLFQTSVTKEQWEGAVKGARGPLGDLVSRKFRASEYKQSLPGAPEGEYVVVYYETSFAEKSGMNESVTLVGTADGAWKVVGYFVQ